MLPDQEPGGRGPPWKNHPQNWSIFGVVLQGGSSSSGFLIWKPPNKETPPGGGVYFDQLWPHKIWRRNLSTPVAGPIFAPLSQREIPNKSEFKNKISVLLCLIFNWHYLVSVEWIMDDTLTSLTSIETFLEEIKEMNFAILREEEEAAMEFPSILKLLFKKNK